MVEFRTLLGALADGRIEFILVGGVAATVHGSARLTRDVDIVYRRSPENIRNLAAALAPLEPSLRGAPPGLPFRLDAETISTSRSRPAPEPSTFSARSQAEEGGTRSPITPSRSRCSAIPADATISTR